MLKAKVWNKTGLSELAVSDQLATGSFLKPVFTDVRNRTRIESEVLEWIQQCIANQDNEIVPPGRAALPKTRRTGWQKEHKPTTA